MAVESTKIFSKVIRTVTITYFTLLLINGESSISRELNVSLGEKNCREKFLNSCDIQCERIDFNSKIDFRYSKKYIEKKSQNRVDCALTLNRCIYSNGTNKFWTDLLGGNGWKIIRLKIRHSSINLEETGLGNLINLKELTLRNTTTKNLLKDIFDDAPKLKNLTIKSNEYLKMAEPRLLQEIHLDNIRIENLNLNQIECKNFLRNLTAGYFVAKIKTINWSRNNIGRFSRDLLKDYRRIENLILSNSNIYEFDEGAFDHSDVKNIHLDGNKIRRLPEKIFAPLMKNASSLFLKENELICDCQMEWLQRFAMERKKNFFGDFQNVECEFSERSHPGRVNFLKAKMCPEGKRGSFETNWGPRENPTNVDYGLQEMEEILNDITARSNETENSEKSAQTGQKFTIKNPEPELMEIHLTGAMDLDESALWLADFSNGSSPIFKFIKTTEKIVLVYVSPESDYLICFGSKGNLIKINFRDCLPLKGKSAGSNETRLDQKWVIVMATVCLFALGLGALISYLLVHKNPLLIRNSKRVIVVKRRDKAQILIMPRNYENFPINDGNQSQALRTYNRPLEFPRRALSYDTLSTASYVSANQPSQLELLTFRMQEILRRNNNLPPSMRSNLPPDVDLLLEYEWYTITTSTIVTNARV